MANFDRAILRAIIRVNGEMPGYQVKALGVAENVEPIRIGWPISMNQQFSDFESYIAKRIGDRGHLVTEQVILAIINLWLKSCESGIQTENKLLKLLDSICPAKVKLLYAIKAKGKIETIRFGQFRLGNLDYQGLVSFITKQTHSDYHTRQRGLLESACALERDPKDIAVVNTTNLSEEMGHSSSVNFHIDYYFESLRLALFDEFFNDYDLQSDIPIGAMGVFFDPELFLRFNVGQSIGVFYRINHRENQGWVNGAAQHFKGLTFQGASLISIVNEIGQHLTDQIRSKSPFGGVAKILVNFMASAEKLAYKGNTNEAFLNFVVGLDAILNMDSDRAPSFTLKSRLAVLTYRVHMNTYSQQFLLVKALYDARSRFVHAGEAIPQGYFQSLQAICRQCLAAIIELSVNSKLSIEAWLENLDMISQELYKGKPVSDEFLSLNGVLVDSSYSRILARYSAPSSISVAEKPPR